MSVVKPIEHTFDSIEHIEEVTSALGWTTEYRQLHPAFYTAKVTELEGDSWFLMDERASTDVEVQGGSADGMYVLALLRGNPGVMNGQLLESDRIVWVKPGGAFQALIPANMGVIQIGVAAEHFEALVDAVEPKFDLPSQGAGLIAANASELEPLRTAMHELLEINGDDRRQEAVSNIVTGLVSVATEHGWNSGPGMHRAAAQITMHKAREFIEANLGGAVRVEDICEYAGTSHRSLHRIFVRELGVSPQQYVKVRRLNSARHYLGLVEMGKEASSVTDVATQCGFTHLGRFAVDYRKHFGETPRETMLRH